MRNTTTVVGFLQLLLPTYSIWFDFLIINKHKVMDYKTKLIEQLEELEADNTQHPSFYDGYGFAISDAIETIKKFNYIQCCKSDSELFFCNNQTIGSRCLNQCLKCYCFANNK